MDGCRWNNAGAIVEHGIPDDRDYEKHMDYLHFNPVKHGYADIVIDWPFSSFHRLVKKGIHCSDWACDEQNDFEMGGRRR